VQHARPGSILAALRRARPSDAVRATFSSDSLSVLGLTASFDAPSDHGGAKRRHALCDALGIGRCSGKQILRQLNCYGFTYAEVELALEALDDASRLPATAATAVSVVSPACSVVPAAPSTAFSAYTAAVASSVRSVQSSTSPRTPATAARSWDAPPASAARSMPSPPVASRGWDAAPAPSQAPPHPLRPVSAPESPALPDAAAALPAADPVSAAAQPLAFLKAVAVAKPAPARAHQKVVTERTGSMPLQYAGPKPSELFKLYQSALQTGELSLTDDLDPDDDEDDDWDQEDEEDEGLFLPLFL